MCQRGMLWQMYLSTNWEHEWPGLETSLNTGVQAKTKSRVPAPVFRNGRSFVLFVFFVTTQCWNGTPLTLTLRWYFWFLGVHAPSLNCGMGLEVMLQPDTEHWVSAFVCSFLECGAQATMQLNAQTAKFSFWMYITLGLTRILKTSTKHTILMYNTQYALIPSISYFLK